jgi:hypothetical protein
MILLVAIILTACGGNGTTAGQPAINFDQETVDIGNVSPGVALDYSFRFTNEGDAPLIVDDDVAIKTLEGCWPGKPKVVGPTTLQPGDESTVRVTAPTVQQMQVSGPHLFQYTVKSNDPVEPEKILYLRAYFEPAE